MSGFSGVQVCAPGGTRQSVTTPVRLSVASERGRPPLFLFVPVGRTTIIEGISILVHLSGARRVRPGSSISNEGRAPATGALLP